MALLTKEQILAVEDLPTEEVLIPEWGGSVLVKGMSGTERDAFEASIVTRQGQNVKTDMRNIRSKLVAQTVVDKKGALLFSMKDVEALGKKSASALQKVFDVAQRLSGLTEDDVKELEEGLENPSDASASDWPAT